MQQHGYELSQIHPANKQFIDHTTNRYPLQIYAETRIRIITNSSRKQANSLITQQTAIPCKYVQKHGYELSQIHPAT